MNKKLLKAVEELDDDKVEMLLNGGAVSNGISEELICKFDRIGRPDISYRLRRSRVNE